jgi:hypothetical protein
MKRVTSRNGLAAFDVDEAASITPLLNPNTGILMGYWVSNGYHINFTYNDLYHAFNKSKANGVKAHPSDQQGILDETYVTEHRDGGLFIWLTSVAANFR